MPESLDTLIGELDSILAELAEATTAHQAAIDAVAPAHRRGAVNLVHYVTLRRHDRSGLQNDLMDLGATSLATTEANVRAKLRAARNVLAALRGDAGPWPLSAIDDDLDEGDEILEANAVALFGPARPERPTRIMVTLPSEAADRPELVADLVASGMDVARINCAHDGPQAWGRMAALVRAASAAAGRDVLISMDLSGPKLRTGPIADGPAVGRARAVRDDVGQVVAPARLWLVPADRPDIPEPPGPGRPPLRVCVDPDWLARRAPGDRIRVPDARGSQRLFTVASTADGAVMARSDRGTYLANGAVMDCDGELTPALGITAAAQRLTLAEGDRLVLTTDLTPVPLPVDGEVARIGCTLPEAVAALRPGDPVLLDDGAIEAVVEAVGEETTWAGVTVRVTWTKPGGHRLGAEKGINLPDTDLALPALTADDEEHLSFAAEHADLVAVSFVRSATDIEHVLKALDRTGASQLGLIVKIETRQGFEELPSILLSAMRRARVGVMIARGDLAVELGFERMSEVPRQILALCEAAHVPVIWATQVLESVAKTGRASRAEITDAAAAQRAECVMLNKGPYVGQAIRILADILMRMDRVQRKSRTLLRHIHSWDDQ